MNKRGFTLIELLVVIVIIGILVAIALPNFIRIKDKAKEAEVKQNLHAVQLALERYAVDSPAGIYPFCIMGGDWTDTYVVFQVWLDAQDNLSVDDIVNPERRDNWEPAPRDIGDPLVMESYMPSYPGNPFMKGKSETILPRISHNSDFLTGGGIITDRIVGGKDSNKMYEVFGPHLSIREQVVVGDAWVHHVFNNPPYDIANADKDPQANGGDWNAPSGNLVLVGNFSYWLRGADGTAFPLTGASDPIGYTLAGYGSVRTAGQDVYNRNGNYKGRFRTEPCLTDCQSGGIFPDITCICAGNGNEGAPPSMVANNGGSDTLVDGVVITLDSGVDKKSAKVDLGVQ